jgi:hypothetical protein
VESLEPEPRLVETVLVEELVDQEKFAAKGRFPIVDDLVLG